MFIAYCTFTILLIWFLNFHKLMLPFSKALWPYRRIYTSATKVFCIMYNSKKSQLFWTEEKNCKQSAQRWINWTKSTCYNKKWYRTNKKYKHNGQSIGYRFRLLGNCFRTKQHATKWMRCQWKTVFHTRTLVDHISLFFCQTINLYLLDCMYTKVDASPVSLS